MEITKADQINEASVLLEEQLNENNVVFDHDDLNYYQCLFLTISGLKILNTKYDNLNRPVLMFKKYLLL